MEQPFRVLNRARSVRVGERATARVLQALTLLAVTALLGAIGGCSGVVTANSPNGNGGGSTPPPASSFSISPSSLSFGNVTMGAKASQNATVTNTGNTTVTISQANFSNSEFTLSNMSMPTTLDAGQSASFLVWLNGNTTGAASGSLSLASSDGTTSAPVALSGTVVAAQPQLSVSPAAVSFGTVTVGSKGTQALTLNNTGTGDLSVSLISVSATGVAISGIATPATIKAGQSASLTLTYAPTATGALSGHISIASNAPNSPLTVNVTGTATTQPVGQLGTTPATLSFGNVNVGSSGTLTSTVTNTGQAAVHISGVTTTGTGFTASGISAPSTLNVGASATVTVKFAPSSGGAVTGKVSIASDVQNSPTVINLSGTGAQAGLGLSASSVNFGSVITGNSKTQNITITNTGQSTLTIASATAAGTGFSVSGLNANATVAAGQTLTFSAKFAPTTAGSATGTLSIASNAPGSPATVTFSGTGTAATFTLSASPSSVSFGNVNIGGSSSQNVTITNTGNSNVTISSVSSSETGVTATGIAGSTVLTPGQTATLTVKFAPTSAAAVNGSVKLNTTQGAGLTVTLTGTGVQAGLSATPASANFASVSTGSSNSQTIQLKNTGTAQLTISQASITGSQEFSITGLATPLSIGAGLSSSFNVVFSPTASGSVTGTLNLASNAPGSPLAIALSGTGTASTKTISVSPTSLSFGSVNTGSSASLSLTVTNTGNATVNISSVTTTGAGFSVPNSGVTLSPSQKTTLTVQFAPAAAGSTTGALTITSDAAGSPTSVALSGTGATPVQHSVALSWQASTSTVTGYNVYRSTVSGSSYTRVNGALITSLNYKDSTVQSGTAYFYVTTAVDSNGNESVYSNQVSANVP